MEEKIRVVVKDNYQELCVPKRAFITFENPEDYDLAVESLNTHGIKIGEHKIKGARAPEPTNVKWENLGIPLIERFFRSFAAFLVIFALLFGMFYAFYQMKQAIFDFYFTKYARLVNTHLLNYRLIAQISSKTTLPKIDINKKPSRNGMKPPSLLSISILVFFNVSVINK